MKRMEMKGFSCLRDSRVFLGCLVNPVTAPQAGHTGPRGAITPTGSGSHTREAQASLVPMSLQSQVRHQQKHLPGFHSWSRARPPSPPGTPPEPPRHPPEPPGAAG